MPGQRVGYLRVSSLDQNAVRQLVGVESDRAFTDHASGKDGTRPQLAALLPFVRDGDTVIVHLANLLLSVMGAFTEFERALIRERQAEGIAAAPRDREPAPARWRAEPQRG